MSMCRTCAKKKRDPAATVLKLPTSNTVLLQHSCTSRLSFPGLVLHQGIKRAYLVVVVLHAHP